MKVRIFALASCAALALVLPGCDRTATDDAETAGSAEIAEPAAVPAEGSTDPAARETAAAIVEMGRGPYTCYGARNCTGKVLNNKDPHNCKNSGGKSIRSSLDNSCTNL